MLKRIALLVLFTMLSSLASSAPKLGKFQLAHGFPNANSGVGMNLGLSIFTSSELPFLNFAKNSTGWQPFLQGHDYTGETWYVYKSVLDSHGYPTSLNPATNSTYTATISDGAGGSGTVVNVTAILTGPGPWNGSQISGTGVTAGTNIAVPQTINGGPAKFTASFSGTNMTITGFTNSGYVTPGMIVAIPAGINTHVVSCPTSNTLANCSTTGVYVVADAQPAITVSFIQAQQVEGTTGYYIASNAHNLGSRTITSTHTFDSLRLQASVDCTYACYPSGASTWELVYTSNSIAQAFTYNTGFTLASHNCAAGTCTDVLNASGNEYKIDLTAVDPANPVSNIRLCLLAGSKKTQCENGTEYFNPDWIAQMQQFRTVRTMDWNATNANINSVWAGRAPLDWPSWQDYTADINTSTGSGHFGFGGYDPANPLGYSGDVPLEVEIALANEIHANLWLNLPCMANSTFNTNAANLVKSTLSSNLKVFVESCNEWFNNPGLNNIVAPNLYASLGTAGYAITSGCYTGNPVITGCIYDQVLNQTGQMSADWKAVFTGADASRLKIMLPGQYTVTFTNTSNLQATSANWSGTLSTHVDALINAPYWPCCNGYLPVAAWSADADDGVAKMYTDISTGSLRPVSPTNGNCGNGVGFSCNPVDTAHFTVDTGYAASGDPTWAQMGLQNDFCISFITTNASTGSPPNLQVDSGTVVPLSGSLNNHSQIFACYENGTYQVKRAEQLGDCGNGYSFTCAGADNQHFNLTTGQSLPDPPTNGTCILVTNTLTVGATPNYIKTDGGTSYKLVDIHLSDFQLGSGKQAYCLTSSTVNGAVSPPVWQAVGLPSQCGQADFLCAGEYTARGYYVAQNAASPVALYLYEGGQQILDPGDTLNRNMIQDLVKSTQFGTLYSQYLTNMKNAGGIEIQLYEDPRPWSQGNWWGFNPGTYTYPSVTSVIKRQLAIYSWITGNPCWWSGCRIR